MIIRSPTFAWPFLAPPKQTHRAVTRNLRKNRFKDSLATKDSECTSPVHGGTDIAKPFLKEFCKQLGIELSIRIGTKPAVYQTMRDKGMDQSEPARKLDCDNNAVRRLLDPDHNTDFDLLEKALDVLGLQLHYRVNEIEGRLSHTDMGYSSACREENTPHQRFPPGFQHTDHACSVVYNLLDASLCLQLSSPRQAVNRTACLIQREQSPAVGRNVSASTLPLHLTCANMADVWGEFSYEATDPFDRFACPRETPE